ncbi:MAG: riboflavin synthase [Alphaproteobacteria bacterium]|nr:MAG: riboflavin synthase [Alphaproteobacteria bacterium]
MFSGIITDLGQIRQIRKQADWEIEIATKLPMEKIKIGDSIACSGVCLTVTKKTADSFFIEASKETIDRTTVQYWAQGGALNLETSLRLGDSINGHLVYGHVDGIAEIKAIMPVGASHKVTMQIPANLAKYIVFKGSVTVNGISLTINEVRGNEFDVNIIPHTWQVTDFRHLAVGGKVNVEVDMIARYVERILNHKAA